MCAINKTILCLWKINPGPSVFFARAKPVTLHVDRNQFFGDALLTRLQFWGWSKILTLLSCVLQNCRVFLRAPKEIQQEEKNQQERHPFGATRCRGDGQNERRQLFLSHLIPQLLWLSSADLAPGLPPVRKHLSQCGEPKQQEHGIQPHLPPHVHRSESPAARSDHQWDATSWGEL